MKSLFASMFVTALIAVACGGPQKKPEGAIVEEKGTTPEKCCCKTQPSTSDDGKPVYEMATRMECSNKPGTGGECVDDVQCNAVKKSPSDVEMH